MRSYARTHELRDELQRLANGVDQGIFIEVGIKRDRWGFHIVDRWGGDWFETSVQKVKDFFLSGY